jgi:hypothetical protein
MRHEGSAWKPTTARRRADGEQRCSDAIDKDCEADAELFTTYLGSEDGGSSTHKRGSKSQRRSEEDGYGEPLGMLL